MLRKLINKVKRFGEPEHVRQARMVAEIVSPPTALTLSFAELDYASLPSFVSKKLVGYLFGKASCIAANIGVKDATVPLGATVFSIGTLFPTRVEFFCGLLDNETLASDVFRAGAQAGDDDARSMMRQGTGDRALLTMLAKDFAGFCNYREVADYTEKVGRLHSQKPSSIATKRD
ncbi:hypothetical protein [Paraburkholderia gardini]|uniref:hypothetical protein n=1 Tax=Paraburkholderia gardini TaxID=2823469 RepID=UPI001D52ABF9|nr:hypothetical protein [Paraburkholderia gardini]CAG4923327.1 hypothetical protein R69919_05091 [Paraburkholderia gardini]